MTVGSYMVFLGESGHLNEKVLRLVREAAALLHPDGDVEVRPAMVGDEPELAADHDVLAVPMIVRLLPMPVARLVGAPRDLATLLTALGHHPEDYVRPSARSADAGGDL